ncbi:MAG TPA: mannose-6-phosphate isomerase, class I [Chitinophagaceae bacterium]|nr:mannose-6-phosphate isomerase, class I [Chitinophagaceae bacterium]
MALEKKLYPLTGKVQHYTWGGYEYIPALLDISNEENKPYAEYWMGVHPLGSADADGKPLGQLVDKDKTAVLGSYIAGKFGCLPYLFKILDVRDMLSIQVHPSKAAAEKEFARENAAGIPLDAPNRSYKDENHKPELMAALSDFWLLHGFKPKEKMTTVLSRVPELEPLLEVFEEDGYKGLYQYVMDIPQEEVNEMLQPLIDRITPLYEEGRLTRYKEDFWAARAALTFNKGEDIDRGIFSIYFFNLVNIKKGDAIFQDAGVPHAYLEGQNAEIMANSDNVLRGGLTSKHVDADELMKHIKFEETVPQILKGDKDSRFETVFRTPAAEFQLSRIDLAGDETASVQAQTAEIFIVTSGQVRISTGAEKLKLSTGESALVIAGASVNIKAGEESVIYRATAPVAES